MSFPRKRESIQIVISMPKKYYVYILASKRNGTLYTGVTSNLENRVYQHKSNLIKGFTSAYGVHHLVYYEVYNDIYDAILREKRIKKWERRWKLELIEAVNPDWQDLYGNESGFPLSQE